MLKCPPLALMHAQTRSCHTHQVHDVYELNQCLTKVWHGLGQSVINDNKRMAQTSLDVCTLHCKGWHFEHLI